MDKEIVDFFLHSMKTWKILKLFLVLGILSNNLKIWSKWNLMKLLIRGWKLCWRLDKLNWYLIFIKFGWKVNENMELDVICYFINNLNKLVYKWIESYKVGTKQYRYIVIQELELLYRLPLYDWRSTLLKLTYWLSRGGKKKYRKIRFLILYGLFEQTQIYSNKKKERRRKKNKRKEKFMELLNDIILIYCE